LIAQAKKKRKKKKIAPNVMIKIWLSSRRNSRNTLRIRSSRKETRNSNPQPREHAAIMVSMVTLLLIVHLSIGMMIMIRRSTSPTIRTRATREVTCPTRSPMVKLTLGKNGVR
jgi:hypothetical protein